MGAGSVAFWGAFGGGAAAAVGAATVAFVLDYLRRQGAAPRLTVETRVPHTITADFWWTIRNKQPFDVALSEIGFRLKDSKEYRAFVEGSLPRTLHAHQSHDANMPCDHLLKILKEANIPASRLDRPYARIQSGAYFTGPKETIEALKKLVSET